MKRALVAAVMVTLAIPAAMAEGVKVNDYSWLQMSPSATGSSVGNASGPVTGMDAFGNHNNFRFGGNAWIPKPGMTGTGSSVPGQMFWAEVDLGQLRQIDSVNVQWHAWGGTSLSSFFIGVSPNGSDWKWVPATVTSGQNVEGSKQAFSLDSAAGEYRYVRLRFEPDGYTGGNGDRGGPGMILIDPRGHSTLSGNDTVNWANSKQFSVTVTSSSGIWDGYDIAPTSARLADIVSGELYDRGGGGGGRWGICSTNVGSFVYNPDHWIQLDLGEARTISHVVGLWDSSHCGTGFLLRYYDEKKKDWVVPEGYEKFLLGESSFTTHASGGLASVTSYTFEATEARLWQISQIAAGGTGYAFFNEVMLLGPAEVPVPEPATMTLLALGGLALLRRRR